MPSDYLGQVVTGADARLMDGIDDFIGGFLAYETRAVNLLPCIDDNPECCLANVYGGFLWMFLEAPDAAARASPYLARAEAQAHAVSPRERQAVAVLRAWIEEDIPALIRAGTAILDDHPRDLAIAKLLQYHHFNRGDAPAMLRVAYRVVPHCPDVSYVYGMQAFAYEQCHLLREAEDAARRALWLMRKDPWAQHALAHVMLTEGRIAEGVTFLRDVQDTWRDLNSFMSTHIWWHLALFHLSQGRFTEVLTLYDTHVWGIAKDYSQDQVGAVSLLARLELAGLDVGERWHDLGRYLAARADDTLQPFLSLQYLYGLARAGRPEADTLYDAIRRRALDAPPHARASWCDVARPAAEGLVGFTRGDCEAAVRSLGLALPRLSEIGGSHAQRDLFEQVHLAALIGSGRLGAAQQVLESRRRSDPDNVPMNMQLAGLYARLDLPEEAQRAEQRLSGAAAARR